jgi:hypothetical protein
VFSVHLTDASIDWLDSDHVICVYCRSMSVPRLCKRVTEFVQGSYESAVSLRSSGEFLVEFRGSRVIEQEMERLLNSDLK